jgi:predicted dehydrogenase
MTQKIKGLLNEGYLGENYHLNFRYNANYGRSPEYSWRFNQKRAGSDSLGDIGSHFIYLSVWFFGAVTHVSAELCIFIERPDIDPSGQPYVRADDFSVIVLTFSSGAKGVIQATTVSHEPTPWGQTHYLDLHGSKGTLRGSTDWEKTYKLLGAKAEEKQFQEIEISELMPDGQQPGDIQKMYKETFRKRGQMTGEFIEAVASGKTCRRNFEDGAEIQRILDAALLSSQEGRKVEIKEIN